MLDKTVAFMNHIGIPAKKGPVPRTSFLPNICIKKGGIVYNEKVDVADILHEVGHIAIMPSKYRGLCSGDMDRSIAKIFNLAEKDGDFEIGSPMYYGLIQASEAEATAWAYAVGKHLEIPDEEIILDDHYNKTGAEQRTMLSLKCHFGIHGLRAGGMIESVKTYPKLIRWTQH